MYNSICTSCNFNFTVFYIAYFTSNFSQFMELNIKLRIVTCTEKLNRINQQVYKHLNQLLYIQINR